MDGLIQHEDQPLMVHWYATRTHKLIRYNKQFSFPAPIMVSGYAAISYSMGLRCSIVGDHGIYIYNMIS